MTRLGAFAAVALLAAAVTPVVARQQPGGFAALEAARQKEMIDGDLKGAIEQYRKIADGRVRALAVQALLRMAECYQKLGDAEATKIYERITRDFADQRDAASEARARLTAAGRASAT